MHHRSAVGLLVEGCEHCSTTASVGNVGFTEGAKSLDEGWGIIDQSGRVWKHDGGVAQSLGGRNGGRNGSAAD